MDPICIFHKVRLVEVPELKHTPNGISVCEVSVGYNSRYKTKAGDVKENSYFYRLQFWGIKAEFLVRNATKGAPINVQATPIPSSWKDKEGKMCYKLVFNVKDFEFCEAYGVKRTVVGQPEKPDERYDPGQDDPSYTSDSFDNDDKIPF